MIESENLRTASLYINNQLLSRGLLRDGYTIDFTNPGESDGEVTATMGRIMAVVNDLILRRDRDAEHRESLSTTLRTIRAESLRQANDIQKLQEKHAEAQRKVAISEASETAMRAQLRVADASLHRLREEAARTKVLVAQTRAACANEVRKRDRQIDGLKKAVSEAGRARGAAKSSAITTIQVTGSVGGDDDAGGGSSDGMHLGGTEADGYDLRMETNAFLAELAKTLSEENETLLDLVRRTTLRLKEMSGWDRMAATEGEAAVRAEKAGDDGNEQFLQANCAELASDIEAILDHLRTILTNPSFVPIEEVVVREEEIIRLRGGWEKMETRWREAVHLIDGWRRRMQTSGRAVNMEELKMGLRLSPVKVGDVEETAHGLRLRLSAVREEDEMDEQEDQAENNQGEGREPSPAESELSLVPAAEFEDVPESGSESSVFEDEVDVDELDVEEPNVEILQQSSIIDSPPLPEPPQLSPLRNSYSAGNRGGARTGLFDQGRKRPGDFTTTLEENTHDVANEGPPPPPHTARQGDLFGQRPPAPKRRQVQQQQEDVPAATAEFDTSASSLDSILLVKPSEQEATSKTAPSAVRPTQTTAPKRQRARDQAMMPNVNVNRTPRQAAQPSARSKSRTRLDERESSIGRASRPGGTTSTTTASSVSSFATTGAAAGAASISSAVSSSSSNPATAKSTDMAPPPLPTPNAQRSPRRVNSRLPLPRSGNAGGQGQHSLLPPPQQSPLSMASIAAKLAASEREADAARVRAKLKAARIGKKAQSPSRPPLSVSSGVDRDAPSTRNVGSTQSEAPEKSEPNTIERPEEEVRADVPEMEAQPQQKLRKRDRRTSRVASRRRSTLNPWELDQLIQGTPVPAVPEDDGLEG